MATVTGITFNPSTAPPGTAPINGSVAFTAATGRSFAVVATPQGGSPITGTFTETAETVRFVLGPPQQAGDIGLTVNNGATLTLGGTPGTFILNRP